MNKTMMFLGFLTIGLVNAQQGRVGVNTETPKATLDVRERLGNNGLPVDAQIQGVSFPNFTTAQREKLGEGIKQSMKEGTLIYNTTKKCIEMYRGYINNVHTWECLSFGNNNGGSTGGGNPTTGTQSPITGNVTLTGKTHYIASIKDTEYIPFAQPTRPATWETGETNGNDPLINVAGIITTQGIDVEIPIKVTGSGGTVGAYRQEVAVTAEKSQNNKAGTLILEWNSQTVTTNNAFITAKLKAKNTDFYIKQLDIVKGLGNDYRGLVLANFTYKKDNTNSATETFTVRAISGIPDKKFGVQMNNKLEHQFIYIPIMGPDGRVWLNNNLGAEYANINSPYFNPARQAGALDARGNSLSNPTADQIKKDFRAYGYLYEAGRDSDGHEVINWTSATQGIFAHRNLHNYYDDDSSYIVPVNPSPGDPCPLGFHTPKQDELRNLIIAVTGSAPSSSYPHKVSSGGSSFWTERTLKLPASGNREERDATLLGTSFNADYQSDGSILYFTSTDTYYTNRPPFFALAVRCIAN